MLINLTDCVTYLASWARRRPKLEDTGASLVEYALLLVLVVVIAIGAMVVIGNVTSNSLNNTATTFP